MGKLFNNFFREQNSKLLVPQFVPKGYVHSYLHIRSYLMAKIMVFFGSILEKSLFNLEVMELCLMENG